MYFITFSEMLGTHGEKIARQTAAALGYTFFGEEELHKAAKEIGFFPMLKSWTKKVRVFSKGSLPKDLESTWTDCSLLFTR